MKRLDGCIALVTGAGRGIGAAIALRYAREGATVVVADLDEKNATEVAEQVRSLGAEANSLGVDVREPGQSAAMIEHVANRFGRLDVLVNNAGVIRVRSVLDTTPEDWDAVLDTNLKGAFQMVKAFQRSLMKAEQPRRILNVSSVIGLIGNAVRQTTPPRRRA